MTFDAVEPSVAGGRPRWIYVFALPGTNYRFVSGDQDKTVSSNLYTATTIAHSSLKKSPIGKRSEVVVTIPRTLAVATALLGGGLPPDTVTVTISRFHEGDGEVRQFRHGTVTGVELDGSWFRVRVASLLEDRLNVRLPILLAQRECVNVLGDAVCQINTESSENKVSTTISSQTGTTIVVASMSGKPDDWARRGKVVHATNGEQRSVLEQTGTSLVLDLPFSVATGSIAIYRGCDQQPTTCRDTFSNMDNFGGAPQLPTTNPAAPTWWNPYS